MISSIQNSLKMYASFSGRATRKEFWSFYFFFLVAAFIGSVIDALIGSDMIGNLMILGLFLPYIAVAARRMHDVGKSGWFILVPIYNLILFLTPTKPNESDSEK